MLTDHEEDYIKKHAYIPEHITGYVTSISGGEPFLFNDYLFYTINDHLVFIGYPLNKHYEENEMKESLNSAIKRFKPRNIALIALSATAPKDRCLRTDSDHYYSLEISGFRLNQKIRNMITRASRELHIEKGRELKNEHIKVIREFLNSHKIDESTGHIFERIPEYISSVKTAFVFSAIGSNGGLVAFDIAEFGARDYSFYMFNLLSRNNYVPGASDLLLGEIIKYSKEEGKSFINLGLGINKGNRFFKEKWGGKPFLSYEYCLYPVRKNHSLFEWVKIQ